MGGVDCDFSKICFEWGDQGEKQDEYLSYYSDSDSPIYMKHGRGRTPN